MVRSGWIRWLTLAAASLAACTGGSAPAASRSSTVPSAARGGVFRAAIEDLQFTDAFDPTGESSRLGMGLQSELLLRTLVTYRHVTGAAGVVPIADLATNTGEVSPDGMSWTFHLKDGVRFGPPVNRPITSADVECAFRRIDTAALEAQYGYLYDRLIQGMDGPVERKPTDVSGI
ncbi:MAG TPA: ABC transporter substrate-binding protein, partial [Actinomycetota bacterium]